MTEQRHALITGTSSGIGQAIARRLLQQGYRVTGISRRERADIDDDNFVARSIDLGDMRVLESALGEPPLAGDFDCFIHAAGRGDFGSIEQFSVARIEESIRVNLLSGMVICRSLVPRMRRRGGGRIVFIGSESALQALREDCASDAINVSLVNPGMVRSPFFDELSFAPGPQPENAIEVDDVAEAVLQILQSSGNIVIDEINLSARVKSIDFKRKP